MSGGAAPSRSAGVRPQAIRGSQLGAAAVLPPVPTPGSHNEHAAIAAGIERIAGAVDAQIRWLRRARPAPRAAAHAIENAAMRRLEHKCQPHCRTDVPPVGRVQCQSRSINRIEFDLRKTNRAARRATRDPRRTRNS